MYKKFSRLVEPNLQPFFLCLAIFAVVALFVEPILAFAEAGALLLLYLYHRRQNRKRRRSAMQYIETVTGGVDSVSKNSMLNTPLPMVVFQGGSGEILWANDGFVARSGGKDELFAMTIGEVAPTLDLRAMLESGEDHPGQLTEMNGGIYQVYATTSRVGGRTAGQDQIVTAYFIDVTEREHLKSVYDSTRLIVSVLVIDNYEEMMKAGGEAAKSSVLAAIDERLNDWVKDSGGLLRKYDRDRYLFVCDQQCFEKLIEGKFSVLDSIHQVVSEDGVSASLSIGAGKDCDSYDEAYRWAIKSIEMALSRGGDQAVVKDSLDFQFYGGRAKSTAKRTKVKSRVMAKALGDLIDDASEVYIMGHEHADMDSVGAAAGICCAARKRGKKVQIVLDVETNNARPLIRRLQEVPEYRGVFVSGPEAFVHARPGALLVVVDTNRPDMVENRQLLDSCNRVAVIDHHRRASSYIESAALNFHEPYASSAAELVTELLQYLVEPADILRVEAEALMAGIVLDTKNFTLRTGGRTFEAAAFLRRVGADTIEVRRYFQSDLTSMIRRYEIIRRAQMYHGDMAISAAEQEVPRVTASKAADDLLTLKGVQASVVLYRAGAGVGMSARSLGDINVQLILEKLGGGGNSASAGGFVPDSTPDEVMKRLQAAIDEYFAE